MEAVVRKDDVADALNEVGLSPDEARVYQAVLSLGSRPASVIAQRAGLKRAHTYNMLSELMEKGIVQEFVKNSVKHFTCSSPNALLSILRNREEEIAHQKERLSLMIPHLERLRNPCASRPNVRFFQGIEGIKQIFEDMLSIPGQNIYGVTDIAYSMSFLRGEPQLWLDSFIHRRAERDIWWLGIMNRSAETESALATRPWKKRRVKVVEGLRLPCEINIYGGKVAITSTHAEAIGILIENEHIAETLRNIHEAIWEILPTEMVGPAE